MAIYKVIFLITALVVTLNVANCGFVPFYAEGHRFVPSRTSSLIKGKSTKDDAHRLFGEPLETNAADPHLAQWWRYYYVYLGNLGIERADLLLVFKDNILDDYELQVKNTRY
ncbi:MAG: hypothetical protein PHX53_00970 [Syntrophales bacterium]|nr:hypothetical protein [Syntrophales bacterium]